MTCCVPSAAPIIWDSAFIACPGAPTASAIRSACSRYSASRFASSSWRKRSTQSPRHAASSLAASHDRSPEPSRALRSGLPLRGSQMAGHPAPVTQLVLAYRGANRQVIVICATAARIRRASVNDTDAADSAERIDDQTACWWVMSPADWRGWPARTPAGPRPTVPRQARRPHRAKIRASPLPVREA